MSEFDYTAWRFWWDVVITVLLGANVVYSWVVNRSKANASAIKEVDTKVIDLKERVTELENEVKHLPDHDDLGALHEKVNSVDRGIGELKGELRAINRTMQLINEHLINGPK